MQSLDGFLLKALIYCHIARLERVYVRVHRIDRWKNYITIFCMTITIASYVWMPRMTLKEMFARVFYSLCAPQIFGLLVGNTILRNTQIPEDEENGHIAQRLLDSITDMNASYATTFADLLSAIVDDEGERALLLANELDAHGGEVKELTTLVREAFG